jgi:energy-coupling factor transporter ATP-binding protein EcfA2
VDIDRVDVERLLGFEKLSIEVDPRLQLIAGPNNAGKSSLLRVLETFFANPTGEDLLRLKPLHDYYVQGGPRMMSSIVVHFSGLTEAEQELFGEAVLRNRTFWIKISCSRGGKITYGVSRQPARAREFYEHVLQSFSFVRIPSVRVSEPGNGEGDQSLLRLYETLEGVLVRSGGTRRTQLQKEFEDAIKPVEDLVHKVLGESVAAVATELPFRERQLGINLPDSRHALRGMLQEAVITSVDEVEVSIAERGTGFQSAMVLGILRYVAARSQQSGGNVVFAIEEPEAFLHPQTQRAMAKILRDISSGAQLLVTTHSPVLVDSFSVRRIVRLPLSSGGTNYIARRQELTEAEEGRLTRYCDATNSELVFANSVVLVEGYGDKLLIDYLLGRTTGGTGGHLVGLAQYFGVRAYVITDKDGVHKAGGNGPRALLEILKARNPAPSQSDLSALRNLADVQVSNLKAALEQQADLNRDLRPWDAFVLASDLEGLLLDTLGQKKLAEMLGPAGEGEIDQATSERYASGVQGKNELAGWLGSKGWNSTGKQSGKAKPHLPSALLSDHLAERSAVPQAVKPLDDWLRAIVQDHEQSPL